MRAAMDHRVDALALAQPKIEGDITVARRQRRVVILALARLAKRAIELHRDDHRPEAQRAKPSSRAIAKRILLRRARGFCYRLAELRGERRKGRVIIRPAKKILDYLSGLP